MSWNEEEFEACRERLLRGEKLAPANMAAFRYANKRNIACWDPATAKFTNKGRQAIADGEVLSVILAGGLATRFGGSAKAAVKVWKDRSFLDVKLLSLQQLAKQLGCRLPVAIVVSDATEEKVNQIIEQADMPELQCHSVMQESMPRVSDKAEMLQDEDGELELAPTGHGNIIRPVLQSLGSFTDWQGLKHIQISNIDSVFSSLEPGIVGSHIENNLDATIEVTYGRPEDRGGYLVHDDDGRHFILEGFMVPEGEEPEGEFLFSTNTWLISLHAAEKCLELPFHIVEKSRSNGDKCFQFERLLGDMGRFVNLGAIAVERDGPNARFSIIKTQDHFHSQIDELDRLLTEKFG